MPQRFKGFRGLRFDASRVSGSSVQGLGLGIMKRTSWV